jgi:hypothetical protein
MEYWSLKKDVEVVDLFTELIFVLQSHSNLHREFGCREALSSKSVWKCV